MRMLWRVQNVIPTAAVATIAAIKPSAMPSERIDSRRRTITHQAAKTAQPDAMRSQTKNCAACDGALAGPGAGVGGALGSVRDGVNRMGRAGRPRAGVTARADDATPEGRA